MQSPLFHSPSLASCFLPPTFPRRCLEFTPISFPTSSSDTLKLTNFYFQSSFTNSDSDILRFFLALLSNIKSTSFQNNSLRSERPVLTIFLPYIMSDRTYENCDTLLLISGIGIQLHGIASCVGQSDTTVWFLASESEPRPKIVGIVFQIQSDAFVRFGW